MFGSLFNYDSGPLMDLKWSLPAAIILLICLALYWKGLRSRNVPLSRRRVRRANTMVQMLLTVTLFFGLSIVDGSRSPSKFTLTWVFALFLLLVTIILAMLDAVNSYRLHVRDRLRTRHERMLAMQDAAASMRVPHPDQRSAASLKTQQRVETSSDAAGASEPSSTES